MSAANRVPIGRSRSADFFRPFASGKPKACEQVAAVCYRIRDGGAEFLLVRTRCGRWTFPKGGLEPGLTHAEVAALEAFEEGGVHGRMEATSFARYTRRKRDDDGRAAATRVVYAHLCEVQRLEPPQEANRNPTWFPAGEAKQCLQEDRSRQHGAKLARVVDRALARIQRLRSSTWMPTDALNQVRLECFSGFHNRMEEALFAGYIRRERAAIQPSATIERVEAAEANLPRLRIPQLTSGTADDTPTKSSGPARRLRNGRRS
jgi:8-oxo-dGTP pyrophosphatase MutT (NUDIX family)